jgi:hypothetical protein
MIQKILSFFFISTCLFYKESVEIRLFLFFFSISSKFGILNNDDEAEVEFAVKGIKSPDNFGCFKIGSDKRRFDDCSSGIIVGEVGNCKRLKLLLLLLLFILLDF